jgi:hypothetical protein
MTTLEWARERLANSERIAATKDGDDRAGWLDDAGYWQQIVVALERPSWRWYEQRCQWYQGRLETVREQIRQAFRAGFCAVLCKREPKETAGTVTSRWDFSDVQHAAHMADLECSAWAEWRTEHSAEVAIAREAIR